MLVQSHQLALGTEDPTAEEQCPGHRRHSFVRGHSTGLLGKYWVGTDWLGGQSGHAKPWPPRAWAGDRDKAWLFQSFLKLWVTDAFVSDLNSPAMLEEQKGRITPG